MADINYFIDIQGIQGASQQQNFQNQIEVQNWSWGESNAAVEGACTGKVAMQDLTFTTKDGKAPPLLFLNCAQGTQIPQAVLTCCQAAGASSGSQQNFLVITLTNVVVSGFHTSAPSDDIYPMSQVTLNFQQIEFQQAPATTSGVGAMDTHNYDLATAQGS